MVEQRCTMRGRPLDAHDRHVRFRLPEPVLTSPAQEKAPGSWLSHDSPETSVMMQVPAIGAFVRALLPVHLSGGHTVTFGLWVGINPRELQHVFAVWWAPEYRDLRLDGALANSIPPWGLLAAPVTLSVRDPQQTPYCSESQDPDALAGAIATLPEQLRRSLTWDQGKEMAEHARFSVATGVPVYFCDPHSPWQRGSNENTNGLLRQYFSRSTDFRALTQSDFDNVAAELNGRPRQTLGWKSPCQALDEALR